MGLSKICRVATAGRVVHAVCCALPMSMLMLVSTAQAGEHAKPKGVDIVISAKLAVPLANGAYHAQSSAFGITPPIRDQMRDNPPAMATGGKDEYEEANENERVKYPLPGLGAGAGDGRFTDPLLQFNNQRAPSVMPAATTFVGFNATQGCGGCLPPDTNGDVGPNHYVLTSNTRVQIYNKTGTPFFAGGPVLQSTTFFTGLPAGNACRTGDDGDPVVLYDSLADRWMISQFEVDGVPGHQCIAVSQTPDPTGAWYAYDFVNPTTDFQDYPHYGIWSDGYYLTTNQFTSTLDAWRGAGFWVFDRVKMLAGDPTASYVYFNRFAADPNAGGVLPTDLDGFVAPPAGLPNRFYEFRADEFVAAETDSLRVYELVPNFATPASSTFKATGIAGPNGLLGVDIALAAFDARSPNSRNNVEQGSATTTNALDSIADRVMFRLAYRNLGSFASPTNSWTGNFTVNAGGVAPTTPTTYQAGIRWFELHSSNAVALPTVFDQGTHLTGAVDPAAGNNNWMGSIAQDHQGSIALGYSQASTALKANMVVAGRGPAAAGTMNNGEVNFFTQAQLGVQSSTSGRWGDYASMSIDPVDECTFYFASEIVPTGTTSWQTQVGYFKYPGCTAPPRGLIAANITDCNGGAPIVGAIVSVSGGFNRQTAAGGVLQSNIGVQPGTYSATVSKSNYSTFVDNNVVVTNGNTTTITACIAGSPAIATAPPALVIAENFVPANSAPDPGEVVTVSLPLRNTSTTNSTNLVATLQATGGVTLPSAAQNYGVVVGGGANVLRDFTFTASGTCGNTITLTLALQDGALNLGTVTYTMQLGTTLVTTALTENFDGVSAPALPAGWTTAVTGIGTAFVGSATNPSSAPNTAAASSVANVGTAELVSPSFNVPAGGGQITFRNLFNLEDTFDGSVLEIAINGAAFQDITTGGNAFVAGGYTDTISSSWSSPIGGRQAWSGLSGGTTAAPTYITSTINLPAAAASQPVQLRWREACDSSVVAAGQNGVRVDSISVAANSPVCAVPPVGNTAPSISAVTPQNVNEDAATSAIAITVGDTETAVGALTLGGTSGNTTLVPNANITFGGAGAARTVTVTPAANQFGTATITVTVTDGGSLTATSVFDVVVAAVNDQPTFTVLGNRSHIQGATGLQTVNTFVTASNLGANEGGQTIVGYTVQESSDVSNIVSGAGIAANGTLTYTLSGAVGSATISAVLQDSGGTASGGVDSSTPVQFNIVVLADGVFLDGFE